MGLVPIWHGEVSKDGKLELLEIEIERRRAYLRTLAGKDVDIVIKVHRNNRSHQQNKWWWGIAIPVIANEIGYDKHEHDKLHYSLVSKCFGVTFDPVLKQDVPNVRSSHLSTVQFSTLMEWVVRWAAEELSIVVPLPNEAEATR